MSEPLEVVIRFDTTHAERDLAKLEERAKKGVTMPVRAGSEGATRGPTPIPEPGTTRYSPAEERHARAAGFVSAAEKAVYRGGLTQVFSERDAQLRAAQTASAERYQRAMESPRVMPSRQGSTPVGSLQQGVSEAMAAAAQAGDWKRVALIAQQARGFGVNVPTPPEADPAYRTRAARVDRSWEQATFSQFKGEERNERRYSDARDRADLALQRAKEREAIAATKNAEREERRALRTQLAYDLSGQTGWRGRADVIRTAAERYGEGSPERTQLLARANTVEQQGRASVGGFGGRFGGISMGLFVAGMSVRELGGIFARHQQAKIAGEGATMAEQFQQQQALLTADTTDPMRYYVQKWGSRIPGLNRIYTNPDDAQRMLTEGRRGFEAQQQARQIREQTSRLRESVNMLGMPDFAAGRQGIENTFAQAQRQATQMRNDAKGVTGPEAMTVNNAANEMERAAREVADKQLAELRRAAVLSTRQQNMATNARSALFIGSTLRGTVGAIDAKFDPMIDPVSGVVKGFAGQQFRTAKGAILPGRLPDDPDYQQFISNLHDYQSQIGTAQLQAHQRRTLIDTAHRSAGFRLDRQPLLGELSDIAALLDGTDDMQQAKDIRRDARDRALQAMQAHADQIQNVNINQSGRAAQIAALLKRDPTSANVAGIVSGARAEEASLRQRGLAQQADKARQLGIDTLKLERRNYLDAFSAVEVSRNFPFALRPKDAEDPATVLKNIETGIKDLGTPGTVAGPNELPELFRQILGKMDELKALVTN